MKVFYEIFEWSYIPESQGISRHPVWGSSHTFPNDFLLATDWRRQDIFVINLNGEDIIPLNLSTQYPTGVAFNPATRDVYWTEYMLPRDRNPSSVNKVRLDAHGRTSGRVSLPLFKDSTATSAVKYLAVDYMTGNVWLVNYPPAAIKVVDKDLQKRSTIISENLVRPSGIAVHSKFKTIYFCDQSRLTVESAYMDGQNRHVLLQTETPAFGLTIDLNGGRLYWLDNSMDGVVTTDLTGRDLRMLIRGQYHFQSIVLDDLYLYYTDTLDTTVQRMAKHGEPRPVAMGRFPNGHMHSLALHKSSAEVGVDSVCASNNGGCPADAICLPTPTGYSCGLNNMVVKVPSPPLFVEIVYAQRSSTRVTLSWTPPLDSVSSYLVRYSKLGSSEVQEEKVLTDKNTVELTSLVPASQYDATIYGVNIDRIISPTGAQISFTTGSRPLPHIVSGPEDVSTKANMDVLMHCEVNEITNDLHLVWTKEEPYAEIYSYKEGHGSLSDPLLKKYEVVINHFKFLLRIRSVQWSDAATYSCKILGNSGSEVSANLVVFHNIEFLTPVLKEGSTGSFGAAGYYGSPKEEKLSHQQIPFMECFIENGDYLKGTTTVKPGVAREGNYVIRWETDLTVYAEHNNKNFTCRVGTIQPDFYVDFSTQLKVLYAVKNIGLTPMKDYYSYGETATCTADGNPTAEYVWTNTKIGLTVRSPTLQLTGLYAKDAWKCRAYNFIDGTMQTMELQHTVRMKDQYCLHGNACKALCRSNPTTTVTDTMNYCCVTFVPCDQCPSAGTIGCQKTICTAPSIVYNNGLCDC